MTAFRATYSDWKLIRSRKVVQVVLELPIELSNQAYDVLGGMPNPASEIWVGVARLQSENDDETPKEAANPAPTSKSAAAPEQPARALTGEEQEVMHRALHRSTDKPVRAPRPFTSLPLSQQAAMLCQEAAFGRFFEEVYDEHVNRSGDVPNILRRRCGVASRREFAPDNEAGKMFIRYRDEFLAWKLI